jgi:hypothetical protein
MEKKLTTVKQENKALVSQAPLGQLIVEFDLCKIISIQAPEITLAIERLADHNLIK